MRELCGGPSRTATDDCAVNDAPSIDLLTGAAAIARFLFGDASKRRKVYRLSENPEWPFFKVGGELCARRSTLAEFLAAKERRLCA